ncbi:protein SMG5 [Bradysia coprophila]|uniref:protein SMG5 n=1 Tax=Bradysia coprophila TaxID=38358 RepID=UPI00187DB692|nr:protein SMG5 [Bradysia coprophila]
MEKETNEDMKQLYRSLFSVVKQLDDKRKSITDIKQIFADDIEDIRRQIVAQSENLIFHYDEIVGKKSREVLWRKGYYELITLAKSLWLKSGEKNDEKNLSRLITEGIETFKSIIVRMEEENMSDDLRHLIDFSILESSNGVTVKNAMDWNREVSNGTIHYVNTTVHASLLSIGDLHRYYIDFNFTDSKFTKEFASRYYLEAFNLNPSIGMAHNQLGTLFSGRNYDLDSTYHYLYSLICSTPFEFSEHNVAKIFLNSSTYVCKLEDGKSSDSVRDFIARFILIADIFFFDKDVTDFISLCHGWLVDLKDLLQAKHRPLTKNMLFKIVMTLFFCMTKLKANSSQKLYSLIALMVAITSEMVDVCIVNMEKFQSQRKKQDEQFQEMYEMLFGLFQKDVRRSRDVIKSKQEPHAEMCNDTKFDHPILLKKAATNQPTVIVEMNGSQMSAANEILPSAGSSGREKESDGKSSTVSKSKKKQLTRRRRKQMNSDESDDSDLSSDFDSEYEMDSNFSSEDEEEEEEEELSSCYSSDFEDDDAKGFSDDEDENPNNGGNSDADYEKQLNGFHGDVEPKESEPNFSTFMSPAVDMFADLTKSDYKLNFNLLDDDDADIVIEEECVYTQCGERNSPAISPEINYNLPVDATNPTTTDSYGSDHHQSDQKFEKLRYKRDYNRIDPNIVIEFAQYEPCVESLKILFDWMKVNNDILLNCYSSNPEFIHKIMKLMNLFNIDIFTRKVYFERNFIKTQNVRADLRSLFDNRVKIPLEEDIRLKGFQLLKSSQHPLDWTVPNKLKLTENECHILRLFKLIDFGFFMCKMKKFRYNFCARSRRFIEVLSRKERGGRRSSRQSETKNNNEPRRRNRGGRRKRRLNRNGPVVMQSTTTSNDEKEIDDAKVIIPKKSYLKNRSVKLLSDKENSGEETKCEIMGKLWLQNEVKTLETIVKKGPINKHTPYLVLDTNSLTQHLSLVKTLIQSKKFVLLVPNAVISELDELKKSADNARITIRFLEQQFSKGSRFIRSQRNNESLSIPLVKIPKKLDREHSIFIQIAQFCNYIQTHHSDNNIKVVTLLTGENLNSKKSPVFSYSGILNAVSVDFERITTFHAKYEKK